MSNTSRLSLIVIAGLIGSLMICEKNPETVKSFEAVVISVAVIFLVVKILFTMEADRLSNAVNSSLLSLLSRIAI